MKLNNGIQKMNRSIMGKKSRAAGNRFQLKVREDLQKRGWFVDKWTNTVVNGKLASCKPKFNPFTRSVTMMSGGFPDFIAFRLLNWDCKKCGAKSLYADYSEPDLSILPPARIITKKTRLDDSVIVPKCPKCFSDRLKDNFIGYDIIGVESKMNGILDKKEKEMCKWYLNNKTFGKILIAKKGEKRGTIEYIEFKEKDE